MTPPKNDEASFVDRHQNHAINILAVVGPNMSFYYVNTNNPGRCHDSRIVKESKLWEAWETNGQRPFQGAVILGDSGYSLRDWLITPYLSTPDQAKTRFNQAHCSTRNVVERSFGVLKKRFHSLSTGFRLKDMQDPPKFVMAACILHNLAISFGDTCEFEEEEEVQLQPDIPEPDDEPVNNTPRDRFLPFFTRH